jgi:hypothetical protein
MWDREEVFLRLDGGQCEWVKMRARTNDSYSKHGMVVSSATLTEITCLLVRNTFIQNWPTLYRQVVGIPMGTNAGPVLANMYLYSYESEFMDRLTQNEGELVAQAFHMSFRLIDDLLSVDNPWWRNYIERVAEDHSATDVGGIYPRALQLDETSISNNEVKFLGMRIAEEEVSGRLALVPDDKRLDFPFQVIRYPHMDSLIPRSMPYGVFMGILHRTYTICSDWLSFVMWLIHFARTLRNQGCSHSRLYRVFLQFMRTHKALRWNNVTKQRVIGWFLRHL